MIFVMYLLLLLYFITMLLYSVVYVIKHWPPKQDEHFLFFCYEKIPDKKIWQQLNFVNFL